MIGTFEKALLLKDCKECAAQIIFFHQRIKEGDWSVGFMKGGDRKFQIQILPWSADSIMAKGIFKFISLPLFPQL